MLMSPSELMRSMQLRAKPMSAARCETMSGGSCFGSPIIIMRRGMSVKGITVAASVAAEHSSMMRLSTDDVLLMAAQPAESSVQKITLGWS
jgi:hypothetical protein